MDHSRLKKYISAALIIMSGYGFSLRLPQTTSVAAAGSGDLDTIKNHALLDAHSYSYLRELADGIGPRLTGSPEGARAAAWASEKMQSIGLKNVHLEKWRISRGWQRSFARAELTSPIHLSLEIASYGWAGSTPVGGVETEVVLVNSDSLADEIQRNAPAWAGKIRFLSPNGPKHVSPLRIYAQLGDFVSAAGSARAVAVIARDQRPGIMLTHAGPISFRDSYFPISVVDIASEHQKLIERLLASGARVKMRIEVQNIVSSGPVESANIIGEIPGYEHPEQVVIIGAHLDSW
ncbi:MAG TPA: hypothetical protein VEZ90_08525, partial [Blastocatellia bacterium]|nr:hypothetical protein [Blastocatellia bacterium]